LFSLTYWSTTIVVMATFDSGQLASLRSSTEVFGPMCLILVDPRLFDVLLPFRAIEIDRENSQITIPVKKMSKFEDRVNDAAASRRRLIQQSACSGNARKEVS
jgi:hypothetical protein